MRSSKSTTPKISYHWDSEDDFCFTDLPEFKSYVKLIESVLSDEPKSIADIHRALGDKVNRTWTMDALEHSSNIEEIRGYLNKYVYREVKAEKVKPNANTPAGWSGNSNNTLFVKTDRPASEKPHLKSIFGKDTQYGYK